MIAAPAAILFISTQTVYDNTQHPFNTETPKKNLLYMNWYARHTEQESERTTESIVYEQTMFICIVETQCAHNHTHTHLLSIYIYMCINIIVINMIIFIVRLPWSLLHTIKQLQIYICYAAIYHPIIIIIFYMFVRLCLFVSMYILWFACICCLHLCIGTRISHCI